VSSDSSIGVEKGTGGEIIGANGIGGKIVLGLSSYFATNA
jgi:hypothetical protein